MELWGGHECTVNRVGDRFRDQTQLTGHQHRLQDLERFAALGIRKLRYPALWERISPHHPDERDWRWTDERLAEIGRLGMTPILGLLHHGSGPRYTSLASDNFAPLFAGHAAAVAQRYPHVADWTPINEPLTTARFSALYGHWYPHAEDERLFWQALLNQVDGIIAAMAAIRRVNPAARLVQTEDLGEHFSTPELAGVAEHFNHRRWATWDLLAGRLTPDHPLWRHIADFGFGDQLRAIADAPCPPDTIGVNFYPTSERFLDHRTDRYAAPAPATGYHDLAAVRVLDPSSFGLPRLLRQAWDRYGLPLAVTESHLGCSREEQLRWLWQSWQACLGLEAEGVAVRALTAWALIGNVDWNSLITAEAGHYESGAFDVRGGEPRATAVARLLAVLGRGEVPSLAGFPALAGSGWWERETRLEHPPHPAPWSAGQRRADGPAPLLIAGAPEPLAQTFAAECALRDLPCRLVDAGAGLSSAEMARLLDRHRPWGVIDASGDARLAQAARMRGIVGACLSDSPMMVPADLLLVVAPASDPAEAVAEGYDHRLAAVRLCLDLMIDRERGRWGFTDRRPVRLDDPEAMAEEAPRGRRAAIG